MGIFLVQPFLFNLFKIIKTSADRGSSLSSFSSWSRSRLVNFPKETNCFFCCKLSWFSHTRRSISRSFSRATRSFSASSGEYISTRILAIVFLFSCPTHTAHKTCAIYKIKQRIQYNTVGFDAPKQDVKVHQRLKA